LKSLYGEWCGRRTEKKQAEEIKDMAYKAVEDGGSSDSNCKLFIQEIVEQSS